MADISALARQQRCIYRLDTHSKAETLIELFSHQDTVKKLDEYCARNRSSLDDEVPF